MTATAPDHDPAQRQLLDELQSVSAKLGASGARPAVRAEPDIPVLLDIVDLANAAGPVVVERLPEPPAQARHDDAPGRGIDTRALLEIESGLIVDALLDEFLPLLEARLREHLEQKQRELLEGGAPPAAPPR